ncbi:MAG: hypothetical protein AMXMBFR56_42000 [Polyangiaceae bacterium]
MGETRVLARAWRLPCAAGRPPRGQAGVRGRRGSNRTPKRTPRRTPNRTLRGERDPSRGEAKPRRTPKRTPNRTLRGEREPSRGEAKPKRTPKRTPNRTLRGEREPSRGEAKPKRTPNRWGDAAGRDYCWGDAGNTSTNEVGLGLKSTTFLPSFALS